VMVTSHLISALLLIVHASISSSFVFPSSRGCSSVTSVSTIASPMWRKRKASLGQTFIMQFAANRMPFRLRKAQFQLHESSSDEDLESEEEGKTQSTQGAASPTKGLRELASQIDKPKAPKARPRYQLGVGKNKPLSEDDENTTSYIENEDISVVQNWNVPQPAKKQTKKIRYDMGLGKNSPLNDAKSNDESDRSMRTTIRLLHKGDETSAKLTKAVWDESHYEESDGNNVNSVPNSVGAEGASSSSSPEVTDPAAFPNTQQQTVIDYQQIDLSIPSSVYSIGAPSPFNSSKPVDLVWDLMRREAQTEAEREPLLVSFLHSTILNHPSLESALSFHLANRLSSPAMLSTQIMSLIREALDADPDFRKNLRADMLAVRDRDPACNCLPDVFLYFKGFHALQTYRVAHYLWRSGRRVLAHYLQSQVSQHFQIDIHPNATLGSGIMLDHGTGIVIGETAHLGHNCSVLHHVTLGGSGRAGFDRHPKVGNGVLLGAGASVLGNIKVGDGCQVGAGTLVVEDLPPRSVAVGVPAKIIGRFVDVTAQPSIGMNQLGSKEAEEDIVMFGMDGI